MSIDMGDIILILIISAIRKEITLEERMKAAYNYVNDRKRLMRDGVFVKEAEET